MSILNHESFHEALPSQLSLFDLPPTQVGVTDVFFQEIRPLSQISGGVPIEFPLSSGGSLNYVDLSSSELHVKLRVKNKDGSVLNAANNKVGPVNLFLQSLFATTEITLQNKVSLTCTNNPYRSMIQSLLFYGEDASDTQLTSQIFIKDDNDAIDDCDPTGSNSGLFKRAQFISSSKIVDLHGPVYHDFINMNRYLLNQVDIKLKVYRTPNSFCLSSEDTNPDYDIEFLDIYILAKKIRLNPAVIYGHAEMLKTVNAKYPFTRTECRLQSIASGSTSFHWDNLFQGKKPAKVVICFVESSAVSGSFRSNPYNFQHCNISDICLYSDGIAVDGPWKLNFDKTDGTVYVRAYNELFRFMNKSKKDVGNDISIKDFGNGYTFFTFQLEPYFDAQQDFLSLVKTGNVRFEVTFHKALTNTMTCIVYSESTGYFEINQQRDIITE